MKCRGEGFKKQTWQNCNIALQFSVRKYKLTILKRNLRKWIFTERLAIKLVMYLFFVVTNLELHNLYSSPNIIIIMKSRRMTWAGHVARMGEKRNAYRILV
jgi:hypothetical protein